MVWCRICGLTLLFLFLTSHPIHAYERDVHYDLTRYLARWADFSEDEAEQVATADQEIDAKPEFNPLPNPNFCPELRKIAGPASAIVTIPAVCKNDPEFQRMLAAQRAYHFVDSERLRALRESAFQGRNLKILGHYLHALQDSFAHSLMDYADLPLLDKLVANLGRPPDAKIIGHLLYGHSLDKTYERPDLAEHMARYVYAELVRFKGSVNRWINVEAAVAKFVREKDAQKQLRYLAAWPPPLSGKSPFEHAGPSGASGDAEVGARAAQRQAEAEEAPQRRPVRERWQAFWSKHKITDAFFGAAGDALCNNPFALEGRIVATRVQFEGMVARDKAVFKGYDGWGCYLAVSAIPKGTFSTERWLLIAAEVLGQTDIKRPLVPDPVPYLRFVGFHVCEGVSCDDIIPGEIAPLHLHRMKKGVHCREPGCTE